MTTKPANGRFACLDIAAALCCLAVSIPSLAIAEPSTDRWQWDATFYLWLPTLGGETSFPPSDTGPSIDVSADQVIDSIESVFMVAVSARRGPWGVGTDLIYLDLGASKGATRDFDIGGIDVPAAVDADLALDVTGWLWTLKASYSLVDEEGVLMQALAGVRMLDLEERLHWTFNGDISSLPLTERSGSSRAKDTQWDAVVGVEGRATLGAERHWYVSYHADIGAGESDLTWQVMGGLGYSINDSLAVMGAWRYLDYDLGESTPVQAIEFNGPAVGITFQF